jgi:GNAT superfamily N-acetyltransferase
VEIVPVDPFDPAHRDLFEAWVGVGEAASRAEYGTHTAAWSADELRASYGLQDDERRRAWAGVLDGEVVGQLEIHLPVHDNTHRAAIELAVRPDRRRLGVGTAMLAVVEQAARDEGRTVFGAESDVAIEHDDPAAGFAARHGYAEVLSEIRSELTLPLPDGTLATAEAEAQEHATGYETLTAWDGIPDERLADRALLSRRMSTDAPQGGLDLVEEKWDEARVLRDFELARAQGRRIVETVARERATGRLVAYTTIGIAKHTPDTAYQWSTLVLREHRGHRLGLLVKAANLRALVDEMPGIRRVFTWNAGENAPMLRVNRALGFAPIGTLTEWQKTLR